MTNSNIPAIVLGLDLNGLGVVRALHAAGVNVFAADTDLTKPTARTRYGRKIRIGALSGPGLVGSLYEIRSRFSEKPVLIPTQEASVAAISAARDKLAPLYRFVMPDHALIQRLLSKTEFQTITEQLKFPIPRAVRIAKTGGREAVNGLRFPCVVKPAKKDSRYSSSFAKAYRVESPAEAERLWKDMLQIVDEIIVQEWIAGSDANVYFCLQYRPASGTRAVSFVGRKLCQWPPLVGGTASCVPDREAEYSLTELTDRFFGALGYVGLCSMEYKRDDRDGRFYMVEPTVGRTDYQEEIAFLNGVNIPYAAYCDAVGAAVPEAKEVPATAWRDPGGYARARQAGVSDPQPQVLPRARVCDAYFRLDDPMPYLALRWEGIARRLGR